MKAPSRRRAGKSSKPDFWDRYFALSALHMAIPTWTTAEQEEYVIRRNTGRLDGWAMSEELKVWAMRYEDARRRHDAERDAVLVELDRVVPWMRAR